VASTCKDKPEEIRFSSNVQEFLHMTDRALKLARNIGSKRGLEDEASSHVSISNIGIEG
jgi:hypothetical protein